MNILKKAIIIAISIILILVVAVTVVSWQYEGGLIFMAPGYNKMDSFLQANIDELSYVANELFEMDYDSISMMNDSNQEKDGYSMRVKRENSAYETIPVPSELISHIAALYESGIKYISCEPDSVTFTLWSIMDESRGIKYSNKGIKPNGEQLIEVRQLSKDNWYYYVNNYEKAKERHPERFR